MAMAPRPSSLEEVHFLHEVATLACSGSELDEVLGPLLRLMSERMRLHRAGLALIDRAQGTIALRAAHGLTPSEVKRGRFRLGDGLVGRVAATGTPEFAERDEPTRSFVAVPIERRGRVLGTLGGSRPLTDARSLRQDIVVLSIVAALMAPTVEAFCDQSRGMAEDHTRYQPSGIIGKSKTMSSVYELIDQVASSSTMVLLRGESGTGKERVASAIHGHSKRARAPFVKVNCAALPETLIETELFGHERGAFTGAHQQRKGRFEQAHGGTLFLDEIGDLSPSTQIKLLRVLQEREFERVGGSRTVRVDVRVITATSRNLEQMMEQGGFRADLYYRLNVFPIHLPALRERKTDILQLANHFIEVCNRSHGRHVRRIATSAIDMLMAYHWPGNVRGLENCIERAVLLARDDVILGHHLPPTLQTADASGTLPSEGLAARVDVFERELVLDALKSAGGNRAKAARALMITERIMGLRIAKFGIDPKRHRQGR